uniref:Uncharacterized protein n=1 Tax=Pygocentrus nattereri TaxID=42514 RepID=A0AAR2IGF8_PYGNA
MFTEDERLMQVSCSLDLTPADTGRADAHPFALFVREDAAFSSGCEVAVNLEGVPRAALVRINPVITWEKNAEHRKSGIIFNTLHTYIPNFLHGNALVSLHSRSFIFKDTPEF